jgi:hypothetical protein
MHTIDKVIYTARTHTTGGRADEGQGLEARASAVRPRQCCRCGAMICAIQSITARTGARVWRA